MHNSLLVAIAAGLGGMLGWGLADFFAKKTIDVVGALPSLVWGHVCGSVVFLLAIATIGMSRDSQIPLPEDIPTLVGLICFGALQMIVYWLAYEGFGKGQLALLNPIFASYSGLVALISITVLGENLNLALGVALLLTFIGVVLINIDPSGLKKRKLNVIPGLKEICLAAVLAAVWTIGWDRYISGHDPLTYAAYMYVFMTIAAIGLALALRTRLTAIPKASFKFIALIGICEAVAYLAISWGFSSTTRTSVVALISGAFSVPTVMLAYFFLKERVSAVQVFAICFIIAGLLMMAVQ